MKKRGLRSPPSVTARSVPTRQASVAFTEIIAAQRAAGGAAGDHFGKHGANDRIWNAAQKLALHAPRVFAEYYTNDTLALISQA